MLSSASDTELGERSALISACKHTFASKEGKQPLCCTVATKDLHQKDLTTLSCVLGIADYDI